MPISRTPTGRFARLWFSMRRRTRPPPISYRGGSNPSAFRSLHARIAARPTDADTVRIDFIGAQKVVHCDGDGLQRSIRRTYDEG